MITTSCSPAQSSAKWPQRDIVDLPAVREKQDTPHVLEKADHRIGIPEFRSYQDNPFGTSALERGGQS